MNNPMNAEIRTYITVGIAAAIVSAITVTVILRRRGLLLRPRVTTVQEMLDRCHDQVHEIETRLQDLRDLNAASFGNRA